jgi:hypothetical protein
MNIESELSREYTAIRSEILTWISVQYTLIAITASVTAISLSIFRAISHWSSFSSVMIIIIACLGFLIAHANAKITMAGAYISVFHAERTIWDHLIYSKLKNKWTIATVGIFPIMLLFYSALYSIIIIYSFFIDQKQVEFSDFEILFFPTLIYISMLFILWRSGRREPYEKIWKEFRDDENKNLLNIIPQK